MFAPDFWLTRFTLSRRRTKSHISANASTRQGKSLIILAFMAIVWLSAGRRHTLALDRVGTIRAKSLPVGPLQYTGGGFAIGNLTMTFGAVNNLPYDLALTAESGDEISFRSSQSLLAWPAPFEFSS